METPDFSSPWIIEHSMLLADSFRHWTGRSLIEGHWQPPVLARRLYEAPFVLLSHGTEPDPLFNYANLTAQRLWEREWDELIGMPSRKSAEPAVRGQRSQALGNALQGGYVADYFGIRISACGRRFRIEGGVIWNLSTDSGELLGQAAMFENWTWL